MHWLARYFPKDVASNGGDIDGIFAVIYWITAVVFLLVMGTLLLFLVKYRHRPGHKAVYSHGSNTLEIIWTVIPALILVWLTFKSEAVWSQIRGPLPAADLRVGISAKQFNWFIDYPGADNQLGEVNPRTGRFDAPDNVEIGNDLHVPVNRTVRVALTSQDVIHSFFLPNLRLKQDAVPGRVVEVWFKATVPGKYEIACAELCGMGHATMRGTLYVDTEAQFQDWLAAQKKENRIPFPEGVR